MLCEFVINNIGTYCICAESEDVCTGSRSFLAYCTAASIIMNTEISHGDGSGILLLHEVQTATQTFFIYYFDKLTVLILTRTIRFRFFFPGGLVHIGKAASLLFFR